MIANRDAWPFREAVNEKEAPNYYDIIKHPMDLSVVDQKLDSKTYTNFHQLESDLKLIVNNSETYNGQFNGFTTNAYSVWRCFRRLTKKYLNHELSVEDCDAFIFPPRYNCTKRDTSNVGKRKKRKKQKKSSKFQALELLFNATQDSIESTFQKFAFSPMSDSENKQQNDNLPKKYQFSTVDTEKPLTGFYNEAFANLDNYSSLDGYYTEENRNENLVFKSLTEWNKQIDENGLAVVLPEKGVLVDNSPIDKNWLTNFPNDQPNYKSVFNKEMFRQPINGQLQNGQLILIQQSVLCCAKEHPPRSRKCKDKNVEKSTNNSRTSCQEMSNDRKEFKNCSNETSSGEVHSRSIEMRSNEPDTTSRTNRDECCGTTNKLSEEIEEHVELKQNSKKRLVIKLSKLNNDWKPIRSNCDELDQESGSESDSSSDSSSCSSSCSCNSDN